MKRIKNVIILMVLWMLFILLALTISVKAEITPQLLTEWSRQPNNVQWNVYYQNTNIQVVDNLPWQSPDLYETYGYTTLNVQNGYVQGVDIMIKRGCESALTHEVGHVISDAGKIPYWWAYRPEFVSIWQAEKYNNVLMTQGIDDIREYFACAYDMYIRFGPMLKKTNPMTYNYMTVVLNYT